MCAFAGWALYHKDPTLHLAETVRFELTAGFPTSVFKTGAINHSATFPKV